MGFDLDGTLYGVADSEHALLTIDTSSGAGTVAADTDLAAITDIAARPGDGVMFAIDALTEAIYTIDPGTGESTLIGPYGAGLRYVVGLAFSPGVPPVPATSDSGLLVLLVLTMVAWTLLAARSVTGGAS